MSSKVKFIKFLAILIFTSTICRGQNTGSNIRQFIDLSGKWQMCLDEKKVGIKEKWYQKKLDEVVALPGTLDENKKGAINRDTIDGHLNRLYLYYGPAWFQKEIDIPGSWKDKRVELIMERTKVTRVWIDSIYLGTNNTIFCKQVYTVPGKIPVGKHTLTILVDNDQNLVPVAGSHAYSDDTQTNWNGIIGQFCLSATNNSRIEKIEVYPDIYARQIIAKIKISNPDIKVKLANIKLSAGTWNTKKPKNIEARVYPVNFSLQDTSIDLIYPLGSDMQPWSEFEPGMYKLQVTFMTNNEILDQQSVDFGMREFKSQGTQFTINGIKTFLRGKHDACVFPITGYPPMDTAGWMRMFRIIKLYGLNHIRFHSWCPPEAAFKAADMLGIYLQPELPIWWDYKAIDSSQVAFMQKEGRQILDNYGNQPSFVMFSMGNEIYQDRKYMKKLVDEFRAYDNRHLYAQGSNNFGGWPAFAVGDDYWTTFRTAPEQEDCHTDVRSSISFVDAKEGGILNTIYPSTTFTYTKAIKGISVPVIGHEIGQYQVYPNFTEISKYTGILKPWNLELYKKRLTDKGMGSQALDFFKASGQLSVLCYRADIETAIRTPGFGGFQLLDLQDYPGQGTSLVGMLDAFMDSKGLVKPEEFRNWCNDVVVLLEMEKYCWTNADTFRAKINVANYSNQPLQHKKIIWTITNEASENVIKENAISEINISNGGITNAGLIEFSLKGIASAQKAEIRIQIEGTDYKNSYSIWIYPEIDKVKVPDDITVSSILDSKTILKLTEGAKILLFPEGKNYAEHSVPCQFISEFWNYKMFTGFAKQNGHGFSPGTMGILTDPNHPIFNSFPTDFYTNWQWWAIVKYARPVILDSLDNNTKPVVQVIDNINRNYKLGLIVEYKVGKGTLLICTADLQKHLDKPEVKAFYKSILNYMESRKFSPDHEISVERLKKLF
jgi:Glycosyl hydrolases family 2, sugar binding domain/Glycosyl hydrolases family 2